jgi:hypothetical protein
MSKYPGRIVTDLAPAGYSVYFDGTGDWLQTPSNAAFSPGTGDFTIECWAYLTAVTGEGTLFYVNATNGINLFLNISSNWGIARAGVAVDNNFGTPPALNVWNHLAVSRSGTTIRAFINGAQVFSGSNSSNYAQGAALIGSSNSFGTVTGYVSNFRFLKGTALYTAAFTPPTQLLNITNTSLLTCNSPAIIDQSTNNFTITANGNAAVSTLTPFTAYVPYNPALGASTPGVWTVDEAMQAAATRQWNMYDPYFNLTTLLLHGNPTNGTAWLTDVSTNNFALTTNGDAKPANLSPFSLTTFATSGSGYFDGTGDYLSNTSAALISNTVSTFTVECWVYLTANPPANGNDISALCTLDGQPTGPTNFLSFGPKDNRRLYLFWFDGSVKSAAGNTAIALNTWTHIACVVNSNSIQFYVNGVAETMTGTTTLTNRSGSQGNFAIGSSSAGQITGYISNFRVTTTAVYTGAFTTPTAPLTAISGTRILTLQNSQSANNNAFLDSSSNNFLITRSGNTTQGSYSPFSQTGWSVYFDGSGDSFSVSTSTVLDLNGAIDFTIEAWVYLTGYGSTADMSLNIVNKFTGAGGLGYSYGIIGGGANQGKIQFYGAGGSVNILSTNAIPLNSWNHIAIVKNGTTYTHYLNGVANNSQTTATTLTASTNALIIGDYGYSDDFLGYMSNLRITKNGALYTSNFTPSTSPLTTTVSTGTVSLLTFQNNRFIDNSVNAFPLTPSGTPSVQPFSPFAPTIPYSAATVGGSGYFDGTGDYLASATDAALVIGSGEFAIEWWEYRTTLRNVDTAIVLGNGTYGALLAYGDSNKPLFLLSTTGSSWNIFNSAPTLSTLAANQWTHFVVTRQSTGAGTSTFRVFVNGKLEIINTSGGSGTVYQPTNQIFVSGGVTGSSTPMQGYMSNVRVSIGAIPTAYQTSSTTVSATTVIFTPPTAPVTTTSQGATSGNVEYLLNFTNAGITDATAKNDLETVGNAQISTTQSKFGGSSMFFDGTGDWLTMRGSVDFAFGTGDFTMECWAYNTNSTQPQYLFMVDATGGISFGFESGSFVLGRRATAIDLSYTYTIPINSWVHYAVTRSGTTARLFINGVQVASNTNSLNYTVTGNTAVGGVPTTSVSFYGYIDDFRITKGFARYTANFVPPTSALQQQ